MRIYEEKELDLKSGAELMMSDSSGKIIDFNKYLNRSSRDAYDDFLDSVINEFNAVDQYIPVDIDHLYGQLPISIEFLFNSDDRLYKKMIKNANHIEPFMIRVIDRTPEPQKDKIGPVSGLIEAIISRYTDLNISSNKNTEWVDKFLRDCFPETFKLITRVKSGKMIYRDDWTHTMNSDLVLNKGVNKTSIEFAYLNLIMVMEQVLFINNPNRDQLNIVYGPEGSYEPDLVFLSIGGLLMTEFDSINFDIKEEDTLLDIINNIHRDNRDVDVLYKVSKYIIRYLNSIYNEESFAKMLMTPVGSDRLEMFNSYRDSVEGLMVLFMSYIKDVIDDKLETIEFLASRLNSYSEIDKHIEYQNKQIKTLEQDIEKYLDSIDYKDKDIARLNKVVGKYQADDTKTQLLIDENKYLKKLIESYEKLKQTTENNTSNGEEVDEEFIKSWISNRKIAIIGGDINWQKKIKSSVDADIDFYHPENGNQSLDRLINADLIFINTNQLSHELYGRVSKYLNNNYYFINSSSSNIKMFYQEVYNASKYN